MPELRIMASTICLNMIVKDEAHVIRRCLASVRPFIDCWAIVDTGSTDGTQNIIREIYSDIPGQLFERPWSNFGYNRTEALRLSGSRAEYNFIIDADDELVISADFQRPSLSADLYYLAIEHGGMRHWRPFLASTKLNWEFKGVLHEYLHVDQAFQSDKLASLKVVVHPDGARSQSLSETEKYLRDARTLEQALIDEPDNARYAFYLAQSYRDAGDFKAALRHYQRRAKMPGWDEETWHALYECARMSERLELAPELVVHRYLEAYQARPQRAEALVQLARIYREKGQYALAHLFASKAIAISAPSDILFVETSVYSWQALDEFAVASYWTGDFAACAKACETLLGGTALPYEHLARVTANLNFALEKLGKRPAAP